MAKIAFAIELTREIKHLKVLVIPLIEEDYIALKQYLL